MPKKSEREYRDFRLAAEERAEDEETMRVSGYASTFDDPYELFSDDEIIYEEVIDRHAFDNTDMSDVIMQYDHEGRVFARMSNNTLTVTPDEKGLFIEADLGGTELGRGLYEEIRGGYTNKMSFGFIVDKDEELRRDSDDGRVLITRTVTGISKLFDVSAVSLPANNGTSIGATTRSRIDGAIEEIRAERLEAERLELEKQRAIVRAKALLGGKH